MDNKTPAQKRREYERLLRYSADEIVAKLARPNVIKISLFGSYVRGRIGLFTDLDVLVIMDTDKPFTERITGIYSPLALPVDADILCYTPQELEKRKETPFLKQVLADEVVLYEERTS